ncbi:cysteine hydrolase [Ramlibacter terrae]|uniref:Cysteine hydrolase n=1 Tax=Ramlibacter terrae TaxID=2732511 RepID=A0ABX6P8T5_9BURK|nr:cysteine hydrolase [Ramlibacter terrae]
MRQVLRTLEEQVQPAHAALLVVDMQNDFCAEGGYLQRTRAATSRNPIRVEDNVVIARNIEALAAAARQPACRWCGRSVYDFKYLADAHLAKRTDEALCIEGTGGVDFFQIRPQPGDLVVDKHTFSGFFETELHDLLQARGVKTLVMTGVATNVCVDSTLRHGFFLGYNVVVAEDCVGSGNQAAHEGTLSTVRVNFGTVTDSAALRTLLGE